MSRSTIASPEARRARSRLAASTRDHGPDHPVTCAARSEFRSERYLAAVRAVVDDAPPLTADQRQRLARILAPVVQVVQGGAA